MYTKLVLAVCAFVSAAAAGGINCQGSSNCLIAPFNSMEGVLRSVSHHRRTDTFPEGEHIGCDGHLCAFFQNMNGATGTAGQASELINEMIGYGCSKCGSDSVTDGNNAQNGILTVNWVANPNWG